MKKALLFSLIAVFVVILTVCVFSTPANAYVEGLYTYTVSNEEAVITNCNSSATGELIIPSTLGGYPVTAIDNGAFYYNTNVTKIIIPNSITKIGPRAFKDCSMLTDISMPNDISSIGDEAFLYTGIYNDKKNWENDVLYIGDYLIEAKTSISGEYTIKNGTRLIAANAFDSCSKLTSVTIPGSVRDICSFAFQNCTALTSVDIGNGVTTISAYVFRECTKLENISIPDSIYSIGAGTFSGTLWYSNQLDGLVYAGKVLYKYKGTYSDNIVIKDGTLSIAGSAFPSSNKIKNLTIPTSVTNIESGAFWNYDNIENVYYTGTPEEWENIAISGNNKSLLNAEIIFAYSNLIEAAIDGTVLTTGIVGSETVIIIPTSIDVAMTEDELRAIFNDETITITSNGGIIGTGCKVTIGEYEVELVVKGDIDGDGVATVFDALMVKKALANNDFENEALREFAADVDGTDGTTEADVSALLAIVVGK